MEKKIKGGGGEALAGWSEKATVGGGRARTQQRTRGSPTPPNKAGFVFLTQSPQQRRQRNLDQHAAARPRLDLYSPQSHTVRRETLGRRKQTAIGVREQEIKESGPVDSDGCLLSCT